MRRDLIEETFEAVDAISQNDDAHAKEELGDVFLNTAMISYMYEQQGSFKVAEVLTELADKLIRRHPHVFPQSEGKTEAKGEVKSSDEVLNQWDRIKQNVEGRKGDSILDEVPEGFPPILRAYKLQKKAAKKGFDWDSPELVEEKIDEEFAEVKEAKAERNKAARAEGGTGAPSGGKKTEPFTVSSNEALDTAQLHLEEEIGDLLFAVINYARKLGVDPETALTRTNQKFYRRFTYVEKKMAENNIPMDHDHLKEEDNFWNEAKTSQP
jgi:tetrapyrrole methylase family protein/MazG family protein